MASQILPNTAGAEGIEESAGYTFDALTGSMNVVLHDEEVLEHAKATVGPTEVRTSSEGVPRQPL